jgi:hypothetical protein
MRTIKVKWDISGKGDEAWGSDFQTYDGEVPPKGSYVAKVKRMTLGTIKKEGENKGKPRISVLVELVGGQGASGLGDKEWKYLGAPIWDGLNIIKAQTGRVNGFLHALTDGSESAKRAVETAFWPPNGPKAEKVERKGQAGGSDVHITQIGKYNIGSPDGECLVRVTTKMGKDLDGNPRAEIQSYIPYDGPKPGYANGTNGAGDYTPDAEDADDGIMEVGDYLDSVDDAVVDDLILAEDSEETPF